MTKTTKLDTAEAIYRGQLKEQVKLLRNKGFKPSCVKKIDLRASTKTLEAIFKEGLLTLLNLTEVTVDPDNDVYDRSWREFTAITKDMDYFKTSKLPITKSLWWVIAYMTNPYFMDTMYRQWDPDKKEHVYDSHCFKSNLSITEYQVKRANVYPSSHKHLDDSIDINIDKIPAKEINNYKGLDQYVKHADGRNIGLFENQLSKLTGRSFDIVCNRTLENLTGTDMLSIKEESDDAFYIYAVCSDA